jgi:hypothetical protein
MQDAAMKTIGYLFALGVLLILVAYYVGSTSVLGTIFSGANTLDLTATGRKSDGTFPAYPKK